MIKPGVIQQHTCLAGRSNPQKKAVMLRLPMQRHFQLPAVRGKREALNTSRPMNTTAVMQTAANHNKDPGSKPEMHYDLASIVNALPDALSAIAPRPHRGGRHKGRHFILPGPAAVPAACALCCKCNGLPEHSPNANTLQCSIRSTNMNSKIHSQP
jgi:hypothetical protein